MDLKQNVKNLIRDIETNTNLMIAIYRHNEDYMLEIYKVLNDINDEELEPIKKRYDDLLGHYKYLKGMYETIKMIEFKDLEII